jgi:hypothetical protein
MLPIHIIDIIMSFNGKEFYWNKYTKETRIRFIRSQFENKLSYLFRDIEEEREIDENGYRVVCRRFCLRLCIIYYPCIGNIIIEAKKVIGPFFYRKIEYADVVVRISYLFHSDRYIMTF